MRNRLWILDIVLLGTIVFASVYFTQNESKVAKAASGTPNFSGIWLGKPIQSLSPSDPMAKHPVGTEMDIPYQPWALAKVKAQRPATGPDQSFDATTDPALKFTDPDGYPRASIHPFRFKIVQTPESIYFLFEYNESWRAVAMNRGHSPDPDPTWFGESVGKWEGNTLVVDAVGFNDRAWLDPIGHPRTEKLHLVERWHLADSATLVNDLTIDDPGAYTKPWNAQLTFKLDHTGELRESIYTVSDEMRFRKDVIKRAQSSKSPAPK